MLRRLIKNDKLPHRCYAARRAGKTSTILAAAKDAARPGLQEHGVGIKCF